MKLYKCAFTDKDVFSDAYKVTLVDDLYYLVEGVYKKTSTEISDDLIGGNKSAEAEDEGGEEGFVLEANLIASASLEEIPTIIKKADYKKEFGKYAKKVIKYVAENDESPDERVEILKKKLPDFLKFIYEQFNDCQFLATEGDAYDIEGIIVPFRQDAEKGLQKENTTCNILVLKDALTIEAY